MNIICAIWEELEKTAELAEAQVRLLLGKIALPSLATEPAWLTAQLALLLKEDGGGPPVDPVVVDSTKKLILACLAGATKSDLEAELTTWSHGRVEVDWDIFPNGLKWLVDSCNNPWPGVKVHVLFRRGTGATAQRETRIFHTAFEVIEHFREHTQA